MKQLAEVVGLLAGLAAFLAWVGVKPAIPAQPPNAPIVSPHEPHEPDGKRPHRLRPHAIETNAPDGTEPAVEFPSELWFPNIGSRIDRAGMCVFTSFEFCALWSGLDEFKGFRDWCAERYPGGGFPRKLAALVTAYCVAKQIPKDRFDPSKDLIQYEGDDLAWIERALANGWMVGCTLYHSPRYGRSIIYHMTCCTSLTEKWGAIQDNNEIPSGFKGGNYEWSQRDEFKRRISNNGQFWAFAIVSAGPPPSPTN